jgi:serine/threonine protein kinase
MGDPLRRQEIFTQALATPPTERSSFLDSACGGDDSLRREVEHLISTNPQQSATQRSSGKSPTTVTRTKPTRIPSRLKQALKNTYVIQERIGGGGMGDLYLATHKTLGGKWAIKVLAEDFAQNPKVVERFVNEAKIEANLQHPNIIKVFHIGHSGAFHYLVMNYVDGEDLASRIAGRGALPESEAVSIAIQICKALECAHDHNITHRDLKPSNIRIDKYGTIIVLDFGIARARDVAMSGITIQGERLGTPLYMSPEQTMGASADARSDLYSLGILMYEMVSGSNPFEADTAHAVYARQLNYMPPAVHEVCPAVSLAFSDIVARLIRKDPEQRYQTAREVNMCLRPLRDISEIKPAIQTFPSAFASSQDVADRLHHVVLRVPETVISRELSATESKVLELTDGRRTIGQILALSEFEPERLFTALDGLKNERAIATVAQPEPGSIPPAITEATARIRAFFPVTYRKYALWAAGIVLGAILAGFLYYRLAATPASLAAIQFDASPFAAVSIKDESGQEIYKADTPFQYALKPGKYAVEFRNGNKTDRQVLTVESGKSKLVRGNFWTTQDTERLLNLFR